jgi:TLC domain
MTQLPSYWYDTKHFWLGTSPPSSKCTQLNQFHKDYPYWNMNAELKRYYLMQFAYWWQQLLVMLLGLEKPRKDYWELVAHHIVTLWLIGYVLTFCIVRPKTHRPLQRELLCQPDHCRKRRVHEHGYSRCFLCRTSFHPSLHTHRAD